MFYKNKDAMNENFQSSNNPQHQTQKSHYPAHNSSQNVNISSQQQTPISNVVNPYAPESNQYVSQSNPPFQQSGHYAQNQVSSFPSQYNYNSQNIHVGQNSPSEQGDKLDMAQIKEKRYLQSKFRRICADDVNILPLKERKKINYCRFGSSLANVGFFVYFIFKFNNVYLTSLTNREKVRKGLFTLFLFFAINTPFNAYIDIQAMRSFNHLFQGLTNEEIKQKLVELDKKALKII